MPIVSEHERNDARGAARLLATAAKDSLGDPDAAPTRAITFNNVYRLLEAYRANALFGLDLPIHPDDVPEAVSLEPLIEEHVDDVAAALRAALSSSFSGEPEGSAIDDLEYALRCVAFPMKYGEPSAEQFGKVERFLDKFLQNV